MPSYTRREIWGPGSDGGAGAERGRDAEQQVVLRLASLQELADGPNEPADIEEPLKTQVDHRSRMLLATVDAGRRSVALQP